MSRISVALDQTGQGRCAVNAASESDQGRKLAGRGRRVLDQATARPAKSRRPHVSRKRLVFGGGVGNGILPKTPRGHARNDSQVAKARSVNAVHKRRKRGQRFGGLDLVGLRDGLFRQARDPDKPGHVGGVFVRAVVAKEYRTVDTFPKVPSALSRVSAASRPGTRASSSVLNVSLIVFRDGLISVTPMVHAEVRRRLAPPALGRAWPGQGRGVACDARVQRFPS